MIDTALAMTVLLSKVVITEFLIRRMETSQATVILKTFQILANEDIYVPLLYTLLPSSEDERENETEDQQTEIASNGTIWKKIEEEFSF